MKPSGFDSSALVGELRTEGPPGVSSWSPGPEPPTGAAELLPLLISSDKLRLTSSKPADLEDFNYMLS